MSLLLLALVSCDRGGDRSRTSHRSEPRSSLGTSASGLAPKPEAEPEPEEEEEAPLADAPAGDTALVPEGEVGQEPELVAPLDYGLIHPTDPPPDPAALTLHALAGYEVVAIYDKPDLDSRKLGYLRLGHRLQVAGKVAGEGCPKGFHQLPHGGYACASKGLVVDTRPPYMFRAPTPPRVEDPVPYDYGFVRSWNAPMWWRIPNGVELQLASEERARLEALRESLLAPADASAEGAVATVAGARPEPAEVSAAAKLPAVDGLAAADSATLASAAVGSVAQDEELLAEPPVTLPLNPEHPWLERGFFVSLSEKIEESGRGWWKTARAGYIESKYLSQYAAKDFTGVVLDEGATFPFGYVMAKDGTRVYAMDPSGKLVREGSLERRSFVDVTDEIEIDGKAYMLTSEGKVLLKGDLRLAEPRPLPEGLEPWERWIDVSLAQQMLVAYEGERPVFVTLVSTGRRGSKEEPFDTPTGRWRIRSKHISTTMDGNTASDGNYSIQDVPWAMFFEGSYALHAAFWHDGFGRVRSHGCVNLGPSDARWLFYWTTPFLPEGWHGVHAHEGSPGTTVIVRP